MNAKRQNKIIDEELLSKANNKYFTPNEFNHSVNDLVNRKYALHMHLKILSLFTTIKNYITLCLI